MFLEFEIPQRRKSVWIDTNEILLVLSDGAHELSLRVVGNVSYRVMGELHDLLDEIHPLDLFVNPTSHDEFLLGTNHVVAVSAITNKTSEILLTNGLLYAARGTPEEILTENGLRDG